jgi:hypothetical protein
MALDISPVTGNMLTVSKDMTLRVWSLTEFQELCEFKCSED